MVPSFYWQLSLPSLACFSLDLGKKEKDPTQVELYSIYTIVYINARYVT